MVTFIAICLFFIALPTILTVATTLVFALAAMLACIPKWFWTLVGILSLVIFMSIVDSK